MLTCIYARDKQQWEQARAFIAKLETQKVFSNPIVTQVAPANNYFSAEPEHQRYFEHHPHLGYCMMVVALKHRKCRQQFADLLN